MAWDQAQALAVARCLSVARFSLRLVCQTARSEAPGRLAFCQQALSISGCTFSVDCASFLRLVCQSARKNSSSGVGERWFAFGGWCLWWVLAVVCVCWVHVFFVCLVLFCCPLGCYAFVRWFFHRMGKGTPRTVSVRVGGAIAGLGCLSKIYRK